MPKKGIEGLFHTTHFFVGFSCWVPAVLHENLKEITLIGFEKPGIRIRYNVYAAKSEISHMPGY
jgi:hypothetical protein